MLLSVNHWWECLFVNEIDERVWWLCGWEWCEGLRVKNYKGYIGYNDNSKNYPNYWGIFC
jgi:hypothetical protein